MLDIMQDLIQQSDIPWILKNRLTILNHLCNKHRRPRDIIPTKIHIGIIKLCKSRFVGHAFSVTDMFSHVENVIYHQRQTCAVKKKCSISF
jgi:hypothetical protein